MDSSGGLSLDIALTSSASRASRMGSESSRGSCSCADFSSSSSSVSAEANLSCCDCDEASEVVSVSFGCDCAGGVGFGDEAALLSLSFPDEELVGC